MKTSFFTATLIALSALITSSFSSAALAEEPVQAHETITPAFHEAIANVPGKSLTALIVDYAPGAKTSPHRHGSAFVVGYVLSGAIRSQVDGGETRIYRAGESWTEKPGAHHTVSENASSTEPAKLMAVFVADTNDRNLVTLDKQ